MNNFIGEIILLPFNFAPRGYTLCNGQLLPIAQYVTLFQLLGTKFGGDGKTTFALPNYSAVAPAGSNYYIAMEGTYPPQ